MRYFWNSVFPVPVIPPITMETFDLNKTLNRLISSAFRKLESFLIIGLSLEIRIENVKHLSLFFLPM